MKQRSQNLKTKNNKKSMSKKNKKYKTLKLWVRRSVLLLFCFAIVGSLAFLGVFILNKVFYVKNIDIQGDEIYSATKIKEAANIHEGQSFFAVNTKLAETKIYSLLTYIDDAKIQKNFPNKISISVETAHPTYAIKQNDEYIILSANHKLLESQSEAPAEVIIISGLNLLESKTPKIQYEDEKSKDLFIHIAQTLKSMSLNALKEIDISNKENILLNYDNRINIKLGNSEDLDYKLQTVKEILINKISALEKGTLDLTNLTTENRSYFYANE